MWAWSSARNSNRAPGAGLEGPLLSHLPAESFMSISVNPRYLSRQGVAGMIPQRHPKDIPAGRSLHILRAKGNRRGMMREPRDEGAEMMCPSTLQHQLQLKCIPEPRVLPCPGVHQLLDEPWTKGIGDTPTSPPSNMVLATPRSLPAAQQLLLPGYSSKPPSSVGGVVSPGMSGVVEGSNPRQLSPILHWTPWWWQTLHFPLRREF